MRVMSGCLAAIGMLAGAMLAASPLHAAEIKVLAGGSMTASLKELGPRFEAATGHKLDIVFAATPELIKMAAAPFDAAIVPVNVVQSDAARARFTPGVEIARIGYGVVVKVGAPKPDLSSAEAMKATLLKAQSVALFNESAAGAYVLKTFERLGIADAVKAKAKPQSSPAAVPQAVAKGEAEIAVFLTNVLIAPGVEPAVPFPAELQQELVFVGAAAADTPNAAAAKALLDFLRTPEAKAVFQAKGVTPG